MMSNKKKKWLAYVRYDCGKQAIKGDSVFGLFLEQVAECE